MARLKGLRVTTGTSANIEDGSVVVDGNISASSAHLNTLTLNGKLASDEKFKIGGTLKATIGYTPDYGAILKNHVSDSFININNNGDLLMNNNYPIYDSKYFSWQNICKKEFGYVQSSYAYCDTPQSIYSGWELHTGATPNRGYNYPLYYYLEAIPTGVERNILIYNVYEGSFQLTFNVYDKTVMVDVNNFDIYDDYYLYWPIELTGGLYYFNIKHVAPYGTSGNDVYLISNIEKFNHSNYTW